MQFTQRRLLILGWLMLSALQPVTEARADGDKFPAKRIMWYVGWPPGGSADTVSRLVARQLESRLGQPVVIENRPGASGSLALSATAKAAADGYTLVTIPGPVVVGFPIAQIGKELTGVAELAKGPMVLVGGMSSGKPTAKELFADIKSRPDAYSFASSGNGTSQHLAGELLNQLLGVKMSHVPYKGGSQAVTDIIGGQVPLGILGITPVLPQIKAGKLRAYAVSTAQRSPSLPDVPTFAEAGLPGFVASQWFIVAAPTGTPADRIQKLNAAIADILKMPDIAAGFANVGVLPAIATPLEASTFVADEQRRWTDLAKKARLTLD